MWPHKVLHSRYSAEVSTPSQNRALSKPMQKACMAKRERHFELSANGMAENRPSRQYALAALAICSRCNFCRSDGDCPKTALLNRVIRWDQFAGGGRNAERGMGQNELAQLWIERGSGKIVSETDGRLSSERRKKTVVQIAAERRGDRNSITRGSIHKSFFIEMAERWLTLAEHAAKTQAR
jgi:hypothetical protein